MSTEYYIALRKDLEKAERIATALVDLAIEGGAKAQGINVDNALRSVLSEVREYREIKRQATALGTTLPNALKSYRMSKKRFEEIPVVFKRAPGHWITPERTVSQTYWHNGKEKVKRRTLKAVNPIIAQHRCDNLQADIAQALEYVEEEAMVHAFLTMTYEEFLDTLSAVIRDNTYDLDVLISSLEGVLQ